MNQAVQDYKRQIDEKLRVSLDQLLIHAPEKKVSTKKTAHLPKSFPSFQASGRYDADATPPATPANDVTGLLAVHKRPDDTSCVVQPSRLALKRQRGLVLPKTQARRVTRKVKSTREQPHQSPLERARADAIRAVASRVKHESAGPHENHIVTLLDNTCIDAPPT